MMDAQPADLMRKTWLRQTLSLLIFFALVFAPAGTLRFWQGWLFGLIFLAASVVIGIYFFKHDPALLERRMQAGPGAEQEPAQKIIISAIIIGFCLLIALPGLDHRWHWSAVPIWLVLVANAGVALSFVVFFVVMQQNSYAASTVRVEADQPVISTGLYGIVRHPMYSGALLLLICTPPALGSSWSLLLLIPTLPVLAWRLLDEERVLKRDLPGYADYCRQVRYRLIPGIW
jgi:protein-S-isoprenylcysteine O-methyltransferase Ste14